jgi:hypothetical protein
MIDAVIYHDNGIKLLLNIVISFMDIKGKK